MVEELRPTLLTLNSQPHLWKSAEVRERTVGTGTLYFKIFCPLLTFGHILVLFSVFHNTVVKRYQVFIPSYLAESS